MTNLAADNTPILAPDYSKHRDAVGSVDPAPAALTDPKAGLCMTGYEEAHIQVAPSGGADPSVEVLVWSPGLSNFISTGIAAYAHAGGGADTPYEYTVPVAGRRILVRVTAIAGGSVDVYVSGAKLYQRK